MNIIDSFLYLANIYKFTSILWVGKCVFLYFYVSEFLYYYHDSILYSDITLGKPPTTVSCLALSIEFRLETAQNFNIKERNAKHVEAEKLFEISLTHCH